MSTIPHSWHTLYSQIPLCDVRRHYAGIGQSPFMVQYLSIALKLCPRGGRSCETGIGNGFGAIWLSRRGVLAEGMDLSPQVVERARLPDSPEARTVRTGTGIGEAARAALDWIAEALRHTRQA